MAFEKEQAREKASRLWRKVNEHAMKRVIQRKESQRRIEMSR